MAIRTLCRYDVLLATGTRRLCIMILPIGWSSFVMMGLISISAI